MGGCAQASVDQGNGINPGPDGYLLTAWMETEPTPTHGNGPLQLNSQVRHWSSSREELICPGGLVAGRTACVHS